MMKNELPCSPTQAGSPLCSDKLRGIKTKQCNTESCGELTPARRVSGGLVRLYLCHMTCCIKGFMGFIPIRANNARRSYDKQQFC